MNEFLRHAEIQVEAINHALANVPADRVRMHVCWGNYEGPHHHDVPMDVVLPIALQAKPQALLFESSNPRHAHEWTVFEQADIAEDKILVPGVIDSVTNFIEHPELVAQRILRFADIVGRERVIAGTDCGFSTFAGFGAVAMVSTLGMAVGPIVGGLLFDRFGGYFWLYVASCAIGAGAMAIGAMCRPPRAPALAAA